MSSSDQKLNSIVLLVNSSFQAYFKKTSDPLDGQFPERLNREEAIKRQTERKQHSSDLFPSGNSFFILASILTIDSFFVFY